MRYPRYMLLAASFVLVFASTGQAFYTAHVEAARQFISDGRYLDAVNLLEDAAAGSPDSAEGHYLLGVARLWSKNCETACVSFKKAMMIDPGYEDKITAQIKDRVVERILAGDLPEAGKAVSVAVKLDPGLRAQIARSCVYRGEGYLDTGDDAIAQDIFRFVAGMDPRFRGSICELLYTKARAATGEESLRLVLASLHYGDRYQEETLKMVFRLANDLDDETVRMRYLEMTRDFTEPERILQSTVEYYTRRYGKPGKVSLFTPGTWIGTDKARNGGSVRYLTADRVLTRIDTGPVPLNPSIYVAMDFPGVATPTETGYQEKIWFSTAEDAAVVYYWIAPGP